MAVFKRGKVYHYEFSLQGRRYRGSTKRTNRQAAQTIESVTRNRLLNSIQGVPTPTAIPTLGEFADRFLGWAESNLSRSTVKLHRINIVLLKRFYRGQLLTQIDRQSVEDFKSWRAGMKRHNAKGSISPATVNRNLTTLKRIFNFADAMGLHVPNPVRHVKFLREGPGRMRVLSLEEIEQYVANSTGDLKDFAILASETGCRPAEILGLHARDLNTQERYVYIAGTKTAKSRRIIPLTTQAFEVLARRSRESSNGFIFPVRRPKTKNHEVLHIESLRKAHDALIAKHFADAPFTLYTFRHTFATRLVQSGVELPVIAELLGHSDISTTIRYIHPAQQLKIDAVDRLQKYVAIAKEFHGLVVEAVEGDASYPHNPPQRPAEEGFVTRVSYVQ
jgi:integrase